MEWNGTEWNGTDLKRMAATETEPKAIQSNPMQCFALQWGPDTRSNPGSTMGWDGHRIEERRKPLPCGQIKWEPLQGKGR